RQCIHRDLGGQAPKCRAQRVPTLNAVGADGHVRTVLLDRGNHQDDCCVLFVDGLDLWVRQVWEEPVAWYRAMHAWLTNIHESRQAEDPSPGDVGANTAQSQYRRPVSSHGPCPLGSAGAIRAGVSTLHACVAALHLRACREGIDTPSGNAAENVRVPRNLDGCLPSYGVGSRPCRRMRASSAAESGGLPAHNAWRSSK